jgi:hypothetical protein
MWQDCRMFRIPFWPTVLVFAVNGRPNWPTPKRVEMPRGRIITMTITTSGCAIATTTKTTAAAAAATVMILRANACDHDGSSRWSRLSSSSLSTANVCMDTKPILKGIYFFIQSLCYVINAIHTGTRSLARYRYTVSIKTKAVDLLEHINNANYYYYYSNDSFTDTY